jgi:uncharacterized protein (DUF1800 family)
MTIVPFFWRMEDNEGMNDREKISHLLRRFGLGAGEAELQLYEPLGVAGTLDRLLEFEKLEESFPVSPWEFCFEEDSDQVYLDPFRTLAYWCLRLQMTKRPLQEKLTLFWHDHFSVSAGKVEFGPMMLAHVETLRRHGAGRFEDLLLAVSRDPAMIRFLDTDANQKGAPNENFARELMELFTIGIGNYTEMDIREAARAFTGWGIRYLIFEQGGERVQQTAKECMASGRPMVVYAYSPDLHDDGIKTILGKTANFSGEDVVRMLSGRPETARLLSRKLWSWFAYLDPEPSVVESMTAAWQRSGGAIKEVLRAMAGHPAFWSEKCVRQLPKSPVDFTVGITRMLAVNDFLMGLRPKDKDPLKPLPKPIRDVSGLLGGLMNQQGMLLLYPPNVGGWEWGANWLTSQALSIRSRFGDLLMGVSQPDKGIANLTALRIRQKNPKTPADVVRAILDIFDGELPEEKRALLVQACEKNGGMDALSTPEKASPMLAAVLRLLFASPEYQHA